MCGIAGYSSTKDLDNASVMRSLIHRGPDDSGEFTWNSNGRSIYLGHRRLSIIDLSAAGRQPMLSDDGSIVLVFNGEIYNQKQLRERYLYDRKFHSTSDTEVLLGMYEKFGRGCLRYLNGDFSFCILDKSSQKMFIARDRIGVKPLYYFSDGRVFAFASEIKAFSAIGLKLELEERQIQNLFVFKYTPGDATLVRRVKRLMPGHFLEYDIKTGSFRIECYWMLVKNPIYDKIDIQEAKGILADLLEDSARIRLMSDVPVGTFFSGGLDSSSIAYFIKDRPDITHYTARKTVADLKREGSSSDYDFASRLAKEWCLNLVPIDIGCEKINTELIKHVIRFGDDLIADGSQIPSFLIAKEAGKKTRVLLSGMGGDELFLGYAGHQLTLISKYMDRWPHFIANSLSRFFNSLAQGKGAFKPYRRYLHKLGKYYLYAKPDRLGAFNIVGDLENALDLYHDENKPALEIFDHYFSAEDDLFDQIQCFEWDNFLVKNLHYMDRMTMAHSIEGRVPFLDHRLVEFAFSLPREFKLSNLGRSKVVLKEAMRPYLPDYIIRRRKAGFGMPLRSIFSSREKIDEMLDREFFAQFPGFIMKKIDNIIDLHIRGIEDTSNLIYTLISFQEWHKIFIQGEAVP